MKEIQYKILLLTVITIALLGSSCNVFAAKGGKKGNDPGGSNSTETPLTVSITSPSDSEYLRVAQVQVSGTVSETKKLIGVTVNGVTAFINGSSFSAVVPLIEGDNVLIANASYKGNKKSSTSSTITVDTKPPAVVSAISVSNSEVLLQFSEAVQGGLAGAENQIVYNITAEATNSNLPIEDARFWTPDASTVFLTTMSQANSSYKLTVTGIKDLAGNPIAEPTILVDPSSTTFAGTDPSGPAIADTDGDGLHDHAELVGWQVRVTHTDGTVTSRLVSSDPRYTDTDNDALDDREELNASTDPRNADTDGDLLGDDQEWNSVFSDPTVQDTDGDGLNDGTEFNFFHTSPLLADTDGDQFPDFDEVSAGNRNPLLADLPSPRIRVGNVNMQLDTRFTFTDEEGKQVSESKTSEATLTRAEDETFATSNEESTKNTLEFSQELSAEYGSSGGSIGVTIGATQGSERGSTFTASEESGRSSEEAYHDSLTNSTAYDITESITREIEDAAMKIDLTIKNDNDIPFSISNLELTAQTQNPLNRTEMIPIGSLIPENSNLDMVNIGALGDPARGPFVFKTVSVFPQQMQELMKNPRGLIVQLANFDITDEEGRNFAYTSQDVLDRTAGITFDLGDGRTESYRVATASAHDRVTGVPQGISMEYALEIIGLSRYQYIRDGGNGIVETPVNGDDVQVYAVSEQVETGGKVITAGDDGILDSIPQGDDVIEEPAYDIPYKAATIRDGSNGRAETTVSGDDEQVIAEGETVFSGQIVVDAGPNGIIDSVPGGDDDLIPAHRVLTRFRDIEKDQETKRFWILFASNDRTGIDLDKQIIRAGEQYDFAYVQDKDDDGVWAREEYLHGSSDLLINSDDDTLTDHQEIREGWRVQLKSSPQGRLVFPNPVQGDSDRDGLSDDEEMACVLDPRLRDTDLDGLSDWEELTGQLLDEKGDPYQMVSRDPDTDEVNYEIYPYSGNAGNSSDDIPHDSLNDGFCNTAGFNGFATDPLNADTDGDLVDDLVELQLGLNPNDSSDGDEFLDDDGDGVPNKLEQKGFFTTVNGEEIQFTSNPNQADTDGDGLPDLLEHYLESNPQSTDTDSDGILDFHEYTAGGLACVTTDLGQPCIAFSERNQKNYSMFLLKCEAADVCNNDAIEQLVSNQSNQYGTNLNEMDSDFDGLNDKVEINGTTITVNGLSYYATSDPLAADTDGDGLNDASEREEGSDPNLQDTDGDGRLDEKEIDLDMNPALKDKMIQIEVTSITIQNCDDEGPDNEIEPRWDAGVLFGVLDENTNPYTHKSHAEGENKNNSDTISPDVSVLVKDHIITEDVNTTVTIRLTGKEDDSTSGDESFTTETSFFDYDTATSEYRTITQTSEDGDLETVLQITVQ